MTSLEKIFILLDIRSETKYAVRKIIQQLHSTGLQVESTEIGKKSSGTIYQNITGHYPGGQDAVDLKIQEIKKESGPCTFPAKFDPYEFTSDGIVSDKLEEFGFKIISQQSNNFELEFKGGYDEACCRLGDALSELFDGK